MAPPTACGDDSVRCSPVPAMPKRRCDCGVYDYGTKCRPGQANFAGYDKVWLVVFVPLAKVGHRRASDIYFDTMLAAELA